MKKIAFILISLISIIGILVGINTCYYKQAKTEATVKITYNSNLNDVTQAKEFITEFWGVNSPDIWNITETESNHLSFYEINGSTGMITKAEDCVTFEVPIGSTLKISRARNIVFDTPTNTEDIYTVYTVIKGVEENSDSTEFKVTQDIEITFYVILEQI